jgi:hypothetical protein
VCVFVSQDPAKDLRDLISKAEVAADVREFDQYLPEGLRNPLSQLESVWKSDRQTTLHWLRRCEVRSPDTRTIEDDTSSLADLYFQESADPFATLRDYLEENFNQRITAERARKDLHDSGRLKLKLWSLDPTLNELITAETRQYLDSYTPFGAGGRSIPRKEVGALAAFVVSPDGPTVTLLTGTAGAGKSGVVRGLIEELEKTGITHLAFRVDHHLECRKVQDFGSELTGRLESPATTLKGVCPEAPTVLIVDQVDAVSEVSGRGGAVREAVLRLVNDARNFGSVRLVLICRSFDLDSDSRLKTLKEAQRVQEIKVAPLDWKTEVEPFLASLGIATGSFTEGQRELLRLPLNLAILAELGDGGGAFGTRADLFQRLLEKKERAIRVRQQVWAAATPLTRLARWMSEHQRLHAPEGVLQDYTGALDILASEHLIVRSRGMVSFFHESFFDYLYATEFAASARSLCEMLCSSEQHLFRRTQTRQILEALRQTDRVRYLKELTEVLGRQDIRFHIKNAVAFWLRALPDPTSKELGVVGALDRKDEPFQPLVHTALLGSAGWFDLLRNEGWIISELNGQRLERRQQVLHWLAQVAPDRPTQVAELMVSWWGGTAERGKVLLDWFGYVRRGKADSALAALCEKVVVSLPEGSATGKLQRRELLLATWVAKEPQNNAGILRALFDAWFAGHPGKHPFESGEVRNIDLHSLREIATKAPAVFLEAASSTLVRTIEIINERKERGISDHSFSIRSASEQRFGADAFLDLYRSSLRKLAERDATEGRRALARFDPSLSPILLHLHLEAIAASKGELAEHLIGLLRQPALCEAGWDGADWKSFADATAAVFPYLSADDRARVEDVILGLRPELESAIRIAHKIRNEGEAEYRTRGHVLYFLKRTGYARWGILETIGREQLSMRARAALEECRRKFRGEALPEPFISEVEWVGSPIARDRAARMTDEQWLGAMREYNTEERTGAPLEGGASQLGAELQEVTKGDPGRFGQLLVAIPDDINKTYIERILWGLAEADDVPSNVLKAAIRNAHHRSPVYFGRGIVRVFEKHAHIAEDRELYDILAWYAENGEANEGEVAERSSDEREIVSIDNLIEKGNRLYVRALNGARGAAADVLGKVLWNVSAAIPWSWELMEKRAEQERLVSVRCCLVEPLTALFNSDRARCAALLEKLVVPPCELRQEGTGDDFEPLEPLTTHQGVRLLPYIIAQVPDVGRRLVRRLLESSSEVVRMIGVWHVIRQSFNDPTYQSEADSFIDGAVVARRLAANLAANASVHDEYRERAEQLLVRFFVDEDADVRRQAGEVFRNIEPNEFYRYKSLAERYINSVAFDDDGFAVLHALGSATCDVTDLVVLAAKRIVSDLGEDGGVGGRRGTELHQLQELLQGEYVASEANPEVRRELLDVIDTMLERELYGTDAIVKEHDRS